MFSPLLRFLLLILCIGLSIVGAFLSSWSLLLISTVSSMALLWDYLRANTVKLALRRYYQLRYPEMKKLLEHIRHPQRLSKKNEAIYYFLKGVEALDEDRFEDAEIALLEALKRNLGKEILKTRAYLVLIDTSICLKKHKEAKEYLEEIRGKKIEKNLTKSLEKIQVYLSKY